MRHRNQPACACVNAYLGALCFIEGWAAEGVGDERGPREGIRAVELHAVRHPRPSRLETRQHEAHKLEALEFLGKADRLYLIEKGGPVLVFIEAGNVLANAAAC